MLKKYFNKVLPKSKLCKTGFHVGEYSSKKHSYCTGLILITNHKDNNRILYTEKCLCYCHSKYIKLDVRRKDMNEVLSQRYISRKKNKRSNNENRI